MAWRILFTYGDQILFIGSLLRKKSTFAMARDEEDFSLDFFFLTNTVLFQNLWRKVVENCEAVSLNLAIARNSATHLKVIHGLVILINSLIEQLL